MIFAGALSACDNNKIEPQTQTPVIGRIEKTVEETGLVVFDDSYTVSSLVSAKI